MGSFTSRNPGSQCCRGRYDDQDWNIDRSFGGDSPFYCGSGATRQSANLCR
jgi:hypothetical protein